MHIKLLLVLLKNLRRKEKELREIHKSASGAVTGAVLFKIRGAKVGSGNLAGEQGKRKERERERGGGATKGRAVNYDSFMIRFNRSPEEGIIPHNVN